jgi:DNA-binding transcriptional LysR family regulator
VAHEVFISVTQDVIAVGPILREVERLVLEDRDEVGQPSGSRRVVEKALEKAGFRLKSFRKIVDLDSTEAIKSAVDVGLGVGFVSRWAISDELELGKLKVAQVDGVKIRAILLSLRRQVRNRTVRPVHSARSFGCVPPPALPRVTKAAPGRRFWPISSDN